MNPTSFPVVYDWSSPASRRERYQLWFFWGRHVLVVVEGPQRMVHDINLPMVPGAEARMLLIIATRIQSVWVSGWTLDGTSRSQIPVDESTLRSMRAASVSQLLTKVSFADVTHPHT
jgi:hypothetical protein